MKLVPSFIHPSTHFYLVDDFGPDRSVELTNHGQIPMIVLDPIADAWTAWPVGKDSPWKIGPFPDAQAAIDGVGEVRQLNAGFHDE